jgi:hypothetical protein
LNLHNLRFALPWARVCEVQEGADSGSGNAAAATRTNSFSAARLVVTTLDRALTLADALLGHSCSDVYAA